MKNKKKLLVAGASAASLAALGLGAFAFFADSAEIQEHTHVGTVAVSGSIEMNHIQVKRDRIFDYGLFGEEHGYYYYELPYYPEGMAFNFNNKTATKLSAAEMPVDNKLFVEAAFEEAPDNLNPGDNIYLPGGDKNHGTDHEIIVNLQNDGSKSVQTRMLFEITGTDANGNEITADDLRNIKLYFDEMNSVSGLTSVRDTEYANKELFTNRILLPEMEETNQDEHKLIYGFDSSLLSTVIDRSQTDYGSVILNELSDAVFTGMVFSGSEEHTNRETEAGIKKYYVETEDSDIWSLETEDITAPTSGSFKFDLGMDSGVYLDENEDEYVANNDILESLARLEGATINIKVIIQGIQYRNTGSGTWEQLFDQTFVLEND